MGRLASLRSMAVLARWFGPWADQLIAPRRVHCRTLELPGSRPLAARLYTPARRAAHGAYLIAPGLHFDGPHDPRMDRLGRILAASGFVTLAPAIPDFMELRISARAIDDFQRAFTALEAVPETPSGCAPSVFSISFGSMLALRLAAAPGYAQRVGSLVLFGGYADPRAVMRFCLVGGDGDQVAHDPLNRPVVFINLLDELLALCGLSPDHGPLLHAAWLDFTRATWSRQAEERQVEYHDVAHALAQELPAPARELFLMGCHVAPGGPELCERALATVAIPHMEVLPHLHALRGPVHIVHGVDDDVIPVGHARDLAAAMPAHVAHGLYITGLYGHTANRGFLSVAPALGREIGTLYRLLGALATPRPRGAAGGRPPAG